MKYELTRNKVVNGKNCKVGDIVELSELDARYFSNKNWCKEVAEKPKKRASK